MPYSAQQRGKLPRAHPGVGCSDRTDCVGLNVASISSIASPLVLFLVPGRAHTSRTLKPTPRLLQGKRHQQNLAKRAAKEAAEKAIAPAPQRRVNVKKTVKIGRPAYQVAAWHGTPLMRREQQGLGCVHSSS